MPVSQQNLSDALSLPDAELYMEVVGYKAEASCCTLRRSRAGAMLFHGISGDHIQGIMEEMERRSKTDSRLAKGVRLNGREAVRKMNTMQCCCFFLSSMTPTSEWE